MTGLYWDEYRSPLGKLVMVGDVSGLVGLWFEGQKYFMRGIARTERNDESGRLSVARGVAKCLALREDLPVFGRTRAWLDEYFAGVVPRVKVEVRPRGTEFQEAVWGMLSAVPYGETVTYGELATAVAVKLGKPQMSAQAVGGAVGRNPLTLMVPCHRVVAADGSLTGYAGGVERKKWLLEWERISPQRQKGVLACP